MINELKDINIDFISVLEQYNTEKPEGMLILQMLASFAEFERKLILERTQLGIKAKMLKQQFIGGQIPLGYKIHNNLIIVQLLGRYRLWVP